MKKRIALILTLVGVIIGVAISAQLRVIPSRVTNPISPFIALEESRKTLENSQKDLKDKIKNLRDEIDNFQANLKSSRSASENLVNDTEIYKIKSGLTQVRGGGLIITLADSNSVNPTIDSIVHASDLRDLVNTLWLAGAQAISINDERLVMNSSIDSIVNTVLVNNTKITNPFIIKALGDRRKLENNINSSPSLKDIKLRQKNFGLIFQILSIPDVTINSFDGGISIINAKIVN